MAAVTVRGIPVETHRAIKARAACNGRSAEAEIRQILQDAVFPQTGLGIGSRLVAIGRRAGLTDAEVDLIEGGAAHASGPAEPMSFE